MPIIEATRALKEWRGEYDFALDGGAVGTIILRSDDGPLPPGAIVMGGLLEVDTALTSGGAATVAVQVETAGDIQAAAAVSGAPWSTAGRKSIAPNFTGAASIKTSVARNPAMVIGTAALTAGQFRVILFWR